MNQPKTYNKAVETIKTAILQGQYEAAKGVNRIQLAVYFAIGKYISLHTRKGVWGTGALEIISQQLRKELPGLRGFAPSNMKNMRQFYEEWAMLDAKSPIAIGDFQNIENQTGNNSPIVIGELEETNSSVMTDEISPFMMGELHNAENQVDDNLAIVIAELQDYGEPCRILRN